MNEEDADAGPSGLIDATGAVERRHVVVIDRDPSAARELGARMSSRGLHVHAASDPDDGIELATKHEAKVVIVDVDTPRAGAGTSILSRVKSSLPDARLVALSSRRTWSIAVAALRAGATNVFDRAPGSLGALDATILDAFATPAPGAGDARALVGEAQTLLEDALERLIDAERRAHELEDSAERSRSGASVADSKVSVLLVDATRTLADELAALPEAGAFHLEYAATGGEALDRVSERKHQVVLVSRGLPDLPATMVIPGVRTQAPDVLVLGFEQGGPLELVERTRRITLIDELNTAEELAEQLDTLTRAWTAKAKERRSLEAFRDRHRQLLTSIARLRGRLDTG